MLCEKQQTEKECAKHGTVCVKINAENTSVY